jgi:hypothetical protein
MTTVMRFKNFRVVIFSNDHLPEHVHILGPDFELKVSIGDCECYYARGVDRVTISRMEKFVNKHQELLLETWRSIHEDE